MASPTSKFITRAKKKFDSRKFTLACVVWSIGTAGWAYGYLSGTGVIMTTEQWIKFSTWIIGLYFGGNIADKVVKKPEQVTE